MKNRQAVMLTGMVLCMAAATGCSSNTEAQSAKQQESGTEDTVTEDTEIEAAEDADAAEEKPDGATGVPEEINKENKIFGKIVSVSENSITISVESSPENGTEDGEKTSGAEENSEAEETGEEQTIIFTENTIIRKQTMGQPGGEAPEQPEDGEQPENREVPEQPEDGEQPENGEAPEQPEDGEQPENSEVPEQPENGDSPEKPEGEAPNGGMPDQEAGEEIAWSDLKEGDMAIIILDEDGNAESVSIMEGDMGQSGAGQPGGGQSQQPEEYQADTTFTEDTETEDEDYSSEGTDENAVLVSEGAEVVLKNPQITRTSQDSTGGDASSFYGVGAALLASDGNAYVSGGTISTDAAGGAGLFAYDKGTVYASGTTIKTEQDTAGGVHAAGGGSFYGWGLDVTTEGESSAAIRSDRGGGTMVIDGGNYISNGTGSPAVYCTADIAVNNAELTANGSEAVCIEGLNSLHLYDCDLTGNMSDDNRNDCTWNVILYQSMSGDSQIGNSTFEMNGGTLTGKNGGMFYTTNTESTITLSDVEISYPEDCEYFLKCTGNSNERGWGENGANGADCLFTAISQEMQGDILWDSISQLDLYLTDQSSLYGAVVNEESNTGNGGDGYCAVYVEDGSEWTVTEDSTVTELHCEGTIADEEGKTVTIQGTDGTVYVEGDSDYVITTEVYEDSADCSGASSTEEWNSYETEKPEEL